MKFAWLFTWVTNQESMTYFPRYVLFVLCGTFKINSNFDWLQIISNEISHQLSSYQQTKRFLMIAYLVYAVIYNYIVKELSVKRDAGIF
jgi:hypothetical protein